MKLKKKKYILLKSIFVLIFMLFICYQTINYLYKNSDITNEEYIKLILSDSYKSKDNNFINNVVKLFSKNFHPLEVLYVKKESSIISYKEEYNYDELKLISNHIENSNEINITTPILYIYNTHQLENYTKDDNIDSVTPNVMMTSYLLREKLYELGIESIVEDTNMKDFMNTTFNKDEYYKASRTLLIDKKDKYNTIKYFIDIHRDTVNKKISTIEIDNKKYARILFVIGLDNKNYKKNYDIALVLNSKLNEKYPGISRGIYKKSGNNVNGVYNQDIDSKVMLIEFGGIENNIDEVLNTVTAFSIVFNEFIGE